MDRGIAFVEQPDTKDQEINAVFCAKIHGTLKKQAAEKAIKFHLCSLVSTPEHSDSGVVDCTMPQSRMAALILTSNAGSATVFLSLLHRGNDDGGMVLNSILLYMARLGSNGSRRQSTTGSSRKDILSTSEHLPVLRITHGMFRIFLSFLAMRQNPLRHLKSSLAPPSTIGFTPLKVNGHRPEVKNGRVHAELLQGTAIEFPHLTSIASHFPSRV